MALSNVSVTCQTVLCTTPFSFGMRKLEKSILWHTVCINKKAGVCSRLFVYAVFIRSAAILAYSGESSTPTLRLPKRRRWQSMIAAGQCRCWGSWGVASRPISDLAGAILRRRVCPAFRRSHHPHDGWRGQDMFPCGRFSRPVKPYSKLIRHEDRLLVFSHNSFELSKKPSP